jgi:SRSO17 transposase
MGRLARTTNESRFSAYVQGLIGAIGPADRALPLQDYCLWLLLPSSARAWSRWQR